MNQKTLRPDVLIVGAGVCGVPLALGLHRRGLNVILAEKSPQARRLLKGEYLQPEAVKYLEHLGLCKIFKKNSVERVQELRFRDLDEKENIKADILMKYPEGTAAASITHYDLISGLQEHAADELGENFIRGVNLKPLNQDSKDFLKSPRFQAEQKTKEGKEQFEIQPQWVVGCDGRFSTVRQWMGEDQAPKNAPVTIGAPEELIIAGDLHQKAPKPNRYEVIRTYKEGTLSAFSLAEHGQRLYYTSPNMRGNINKVYRQKVETLLKQISPLAEVGGLNPTEPLVGFPAYGQWLARPVKERFILAGDSVAVTSPYGGQGMTACMEHAKFLTEEFDFDVQNNNSIVKSFSARRYCDFTKQTHKRIQLLNFGLYYLFFSRQPVFKDVTSYIADVWHTNPDLSSRVMRLFGGLDKDKPGTMELMELWGLARWPKSATRLRELFKNI